MKATRNLIGRLTMGCVLAYCLSLSTSTSFAIEGLKLRVQGSNVILYWPSVQNETYIVQCTTNLSAPITWITLTDLYPASVSGNVTYFTNFNSVNYPPLIASDGDGGGDITPLDTDMVTTSEATAATATAATLVTGEILAVPKNGQGDAAPLAIYPIGFDMSNFTIVNTATGESVDGSGYVISSPATASDSEVQSDDDIQPLNVNGTTNQNCGFYRVVRDGAHIYGITNGTFLTGVVKIPVELANPYGTVSSLSLTENDSPIGNSIQTTPSISPLSLVVDTTQMSNGVHQISASARWDDTNGGLWEADSPSVSVVVSNEISFPNWMPNFGELGTTLAFNATSAHTNTDWIVYIYDDAYNYLGYFPGHTDDGNISFYWDYSGTPYGTNSFFIFEVATEYVDPVTPPIYKVTDSWSGPGAWVAVTQHAWDGAIDHELLYEELGGFVGGAQGTGWQVNPPPYQGTYGIAPYALHYYTGDPQGDADWQNFRNALYNPTSRNLLYFGHGGPTGIGGNSANTNRFITSAEVANMLHTIPLGQTNRHAFRFVFMDGCSTGKGSFPEAFGIIHRENVDLNDYIAASMRPSAFVGWSADKWIAFLNGTYINYDHVNFISFIQTDMLLNGDGIQAAITWANSQSGTFWSFNWLNAMKVYGFSDLHFGQYNN